MSGDTSGPELPPAPRIWRFGVVEFDDGRRELRVDGQSCAIEAKPLAVLQELLCQRGAVVTKDELMAALWPGAAAEQSLTTAISKLRAALGAHGWSIVRAVRGKGYQIGVPIAVRTSPGQLACTFVCRPGETVPERPHWVLDHSLGAGAANDVWLARHRKTGECRVFKFALSASRLEALKREVALSRILHAALGDRPDFVRIGEWCFDAEPFCIESPFGGPALPDWVAGLGGVEVLPLAERVRLVAQVARTVAAAHDVGVLHRDIKPSNILVAGNGEVLRLVDFGSGRLTEAARPTGVTISGIGLDGTGSGAPGGTWHYVAPEILAGGPATMAADVYALGILLYQLAAGDLDRPLAAGWETDIADPVLCTDVADAAMGDPARRLTSAARLADRLDALDERRALRAAEERAAEEREHLLRTAELRRLEALASGQRAAHAVQLARRTQAALLALLVLLGVSTASFLYARQQGHAATAQRDRAHQIAGAASEAVSGLVNGMAQDLRDRAGLPLDVIQTLLGGAETIVGRLARFAPEEPDLQRLRARASAEFADTYLHRGDLPGALDAAQRAADLQKALLLRQPNNTVLRRELSQSLRWIGDVRLKQHDFFAALAAYTAVVDIMTRLAAGDPTSADFQQRLARAEEAVGDVQLAQARNEVALATYRRADDIAVQGLAAHPDDPGWQLDRSQTQEKIGDALDAADNRSGALAAYQTDLAIRRRLVLLDPGNARWLRDVAVADGDVADELKALGSPAEALALYRAGAEIYRGLAASDPANTQYQDDVADNCNDMGTTEAALGQRDGAIRTFQTGIAVMQLLVLKSPTDAGFQQQLLALQTNFARTVLTGSDMAAASPSVTGAFRPATGVAGANSSDTVLANSLAQTHEPAQEASAH